LTLSRWWYFPILPNENNFPAACRQTLTAFIRSISSHLSRKRPADTFLDFLTNSSSIFIVFLSELCSATNASPNAGAVDAVDTYLQLKPQSNLAHVMDRKHQERKLEMVAEDILQNYLEHKTYNCYPAHIFLKEVLAKLILDRTIETCSQPEWINGWIVYLLEDGEPELMEAIDAGVEKSAGQQWENARMQVSIAEKTKAETEKMNSDITRHKRAVSKAQEAMEEAMREAQRLTQMIAEEEARKAKESEQQPTPISSTTTLSDVPSEDTTQGVVTPTSSQDEMNELGNTKHDEQERPLKEPSAPSEDNPPSDLMAKSSFTSFDQLHLPDPQPSPDTDSPIKKEPEPLTLHNAKISIFDDSLPGEKAVIRAKPPTDYLIQIEPASSQHPGWMIARKFADFETLHEILRRISVISGVGFTEAHAQLPNWKGHTKASLRGELERYLNDAVHFKPLAESNGMLKFLEKDAGLTKSNKGFPGLGWPTPTAFESMGKGMMDVLTKAPNQVAGGGKALLGGVTGVLGGKKTGSPSVSRSNTESLAGGRGHQRAESTISPLPSQMPPTTTPSHTRSESTVSPLPTLRKSQDSLRAFPIIDTQPERIPQMERRPSYNPDESKGRSSMSSRRSSAFASRDHSRAPSVRSTRESIDLSPVMGGDQILNLPPPPADIADDYSVDGSASPKHVTQPALPPRPKLGSRSSTDIVNTASPQTPVSSLSPSQVLPQPPKPKPKPPLSEQETQVAIELIFAIVSELYTLSSAWTFRKTLLTAAKTFLLRPGNPQLSSITTLIQETILDATTSDAGIAAHVLKLRENSLPTEPELAKWPKPLNDAEKEKLRIRARKLLCERGVPVQLGAVMGAQATGEAMGRVFDCIQVPAVARGLIFGVTLQAIRAVTQ
jgi:hypothetical protein